MGGGLVVDVLFGEWDEGGDVCVGACEGWLGRGGCGFGCCARGSDGFNLCCAIERDAVFGWLMDLSADLGMAGDFGLVSVGSVGILRFCFAFVYVLHICSGD